VRGTPPRVPLPPVASPAAEVPTLTAAAIATYANCFSQPCTLATVVDGRSLQ
jgi:hypothetical protein